jgi:1,2-diacylglycerol 3-alpha-glucosyltransferase
MQCGSNAVGFRQRNRAADEVRRTCAARPCGGYEAGARSHGLGYLDCSGRSFSERICFPVKEFDAKNSGVRLAIVFDRLGPYHAARLAAVGRRAAVTAIEVAGHSMEYDWIKIDGVLNFGRCTLFPDSASQDISVRQLKAKLYAALERLKPDIVAIPGWADRSALLALNWCFESRTPVVLMSASTIIDARRYWLKERVKTRILSLVGAALTGGKRSACYMATLGMPAERVFVGYDVVDNAYFAQGARQAREAAERTRQALQLPQHYFLASARFVPKKNLSRLLLAYKRYRALRGERSWKLVILGDGPLRERLHAQCRALKLNADVIFPGFVQYDQLPAYYGLASAFVHVSVVEQWGLVVNEALAAGLPILVSDRCGCVPELVSEGRNGFAFDPLEIEQLAALMARLSDFKDLGIMGQVSQQIIAKWSPDRFAEGMLSAAKTAQAAGSPRPGLVESFLLRTLPHL